MEAKMNMRIGPCPAEKMAKKNKPTFVSFYIAAKNVQRLLSLRLNEIPLGSVSEIRGYLGLPPPSHCYRILVPRKAVEVFDPVYRAGKFAKFDPRVCDLDQVLSSLERPILRFRVAS